MSRLAQKGLNLTFIEATKFSLCLSDKLGLPWDCWECWQPWELQQIGFSLKPCGKAALALVLCSPTKDTSLAQLSCPGFGAAALLLQLRTPFGAA